jgi:uncharacterized protein (DUF1800 family)
MKKSIILIFSSFLFAINAQVYNDYVGAGHFQGVTVTGSDNANSTTANNVGDGSGIGTGLKGASRFLGQATIGADMETIEEVADKGLSIWLDEQLALAPEVSFTDTTEKIWEEFKAKYIAMYGAGAVVDNPSVLILSIYWRMAYWNNMLKSKDILRQRVALALSEIFVVSEKSLLQTSGFGLSHYYDLLYASSFGNYRDLLLDITMHPSMGYYLSHLNNPKSDTVNNIHPDENYAREVMQLFSIGLYELNLDGTRKLDGLGNFIQTYDNSDIGEFAKIFTGFAPGQYYWHWDPNIALIPVQWGNSSNIPTTINMTMPMQIMDIWHEQGVKNLLNNQVVPSGQSGIQDVNDAVDNLFNHPNVGPFLARLLIQRLVKSNPTPSYIERVAKVFNDNGQGERGNLGAVVKSILLDSEARDCSWLDDPYSGKLREPFVKSTQLLKAFNAYNNSNKLYGLGYIVDEVFKQHVLNSPSVFNFYLPDFQPNGEIADADLVAPEFQLHTSTSSVDNVNFLYQSFIAKIYLYASTNSSTTSIGIPEINPLLFDPIDSVRLDLTDELLLLNDPEELIDRLDIILTGGQLTDETKATIVQSITPLASYSDYLMRAALYFVMISPDYNIRK